MLVLQLGRDYRAALHLIQAETLNDAGQIQTSRDALKSPSNWTS